MFLFLTPDRPTPESTPNQDPIYVIYQYYVDKNPQRQKEIVYCLQQNVANPLVAKVFLLNERIYTPEEMGYNDYNRSTLDKITQVNIEKRITYADIFKYVRENEINGYIVFMNADMFLDNTIDNIRRTRIHEEKAMYAQLRFEYAGLRGKSPIFGPRYDSQDTWIIHSSQCPTRTQERALKFNFGVPGCDNKLVYLFAIFGYKVYNDPMLIKTYHYHSSNSRNYTQKDQIPTPYGLCVPYGYNLDTYSSFRLMKFGEIMGRTQNFKNMRLEDNNMFREYIAGKLSRGEQFIVPRIQWGAETQLSHLLIQANGTNGLTAEQQQMYNVHIPTLKNNAGIQVANLTQANEYAKSYFKAFEHADIMLGWEQWGYIYGHVAAQQDYIMNRYRQANLLWSAAMDIFHYIYGKPWTHALKGKRVLIVNPFVESIKEKIPIRAELYDGIDLFPECELLTIKPPQTQGSEPSLGYFADDLAEFYSRLDAVEGKYDIALVSAGGYGNLICDAIYSKGKSAICVGGVLQMYFGILGTRWLQDKPDIIRLFMNKSWSKCKEEERPAGYKGIDNGCYW